MLMLMGGRPVLLPATVSHNSRQSFFQRFPEGFTHVNHNDRKFVAANAKCVILTAECTF